MKYVIELNSINYLSNDSFDNDLKNDFLEMSKKSFCTLIIQQTINFCYLCLQDEP